MDVDALPSINKVFTLLRCTLLYFTLLCFTLLYFTLPYFTVLYSTLIYFRTRDASAAADVTLVSASHLCKQALRDDLSHLTTSLSLEMFDSPV